MRASTLAAALLLPMVFAACARQEPETVAVPALSAAEQDLLRASAGVIRGALDELGDNP